MYYCTSVKYKKRQDHFVCSTHRHRKDECSGHYIRAVVLEELVWAHMKNVISYVTRYESYFRERMTSKLQVQSQEIIRVHKKKLAQDEKRLAELDRLFIRIYEDNVAGRLSDERFAMMSKTYEDEQEQLKREIEELKTNISQQEQQADGIDLFIQRVQKYVSLEELTPYALRELVKAIYIGAPDKSSGKRQQSIYISYDFVDFIPLEQLMKEEMA